MISCLPYSAPLLLLPFFLLYISLPFLVCEIAKIHLLIRYFLCFNVSNAGISILDVCNAQHYRTSSVVWVSALWVSAASANGVCWWLNLEGMWLWVTQNQRRWLSEILMWLVSVSAQSEINPLLTPHIIWVY